MLVLTRKLAETIHIGDDVVIKVISTGKGSVQIGIAAPRSIRVMRGEIANAVPAPVVPSPVVPAPLAASLRVVSDQYPAVA